MALFNKLFSNRKGTHKHQDNVSEKFFAFSKDQVRVVLFRECDFRGRKLLFDSNSVRKVPISFTKSGEIIKSPENEKYSEIADGYGYVYTKPEPDFNQLAEMVFGAVAMSFRGTSFKMHSLEAPNRLMFTQVFSSPRLSNHSRVSISSRSDPHSLEHSKLDDSGTSSTNSMSEHLSVHSTASDTVLVCRRPHSTPLDVPIIGNTSLSIPSLIGDSGYGAYHSYTNSNGPSSIWGSISEENGTSPKSLSSSSLYKRWLRRTSTSLENSGLSLTTSGSAHEGEGRHHRCSKLGLALILQLTSGQEEELRQFLMEHVVLLESMLWRARQVVEIAYIKSQNFASLMVELAQFSAQYLVNLLSGSYLSMNLWLSLSNGCDNSNSISAFSNKTLSDISTDFYNSNSLDSLASSEHSGDFQLFNFTKFLKTDPFNFKKNIFGDSRILTAEKFLQDFCELLEDVDVKSTNFFMSTLLTAVLTYHLGWVNTCLPNDTSLHSRQPFNPLWGELSDLFGAVGHPTKIAQTIISGTNKKDLISKILVSLTYFIRCCDVDRRVPIRADVQEENQVVETICRKYSCIPLGNYKKYEDHLKEIMNNNKEFFNNCNLTKNDELEMSVVRKENEPVKVSGLVKSQTCFESLSNLEDDTHQPESRFLPLYPNLATVKIPEESSSFPDKFCDEIVKKEKTLCRVPSSALLSQMDNEKSLATIDPDNDYPLQKTTISGKNKDVVFVLGDNEQLVGIKKETTMPEKQESSSSVKRRPSFLDFSKPRFSPNFKDSDFIENHKSIIKPSTSWSSVAENEPSPPQKTSENRTYSKKFTRSQSEPPEDRKPEDPKNKSKYRYSGVKFNLQQYPQILSNYMKSKNVEISNLQFGDKGMKIDELSTLSDTIISKYPEVDEDYEDGEALQTPSNASELEFTSDLFDEPSSAKQTKESNGDSPLRLCFDKHVPNTLIEEVGKNEDKRTKRKMSSSCTDHKMKITHFPMPKSKFLKPMTNPIRYTSSLLRAASDNYMPGMVLQGPVVPKQMWESRLKSDLALASQHSLIDQPVEEAVAVIANIDTWEVQLMSSHTFLIDKGSSGIRIGMSQLVSNMLESLLQMWKLKVPPQFCLMHIEQTLQELCVRSKALAELLLATEFCNMEQLTSTLQLEVNDVPLLLAVASTHSPQVTQKYGLSFQ